MTIRFGFLSDKTINILELISMLSIFLALVCVLIFNINVFSQCNLILVINCILSTLGDSRILFRKMAPLVLNTLFGFAILLNIFSDLLLGTLGVIYLIIIYLRYSLEQDPSNQRNSK